MMSVVNELTVNKNLGNYALLLSVIPIFGIPSQYFIILLKRLEYVEIIYI